MGAPPVPTVGRAVHYVSFGTPGGEFTKQCRAATITEVGAWLTVLVGPETFDNDGDLHRTVDQWWDPESCALTVQNPTGLFFNVCPHDEGTYDESAVRTYPGGSWHWPEKVGP